RDVAGDVGAAAAAGARLECDGRRCGRIHRGGPRFWSAPGLEGVQRRSDCGASLLAVLTYRYLIAGAFRQLWRFRLRSGLAIVCAAFGVAGIITSVDYASSGRQQVLDQIRRMGTNIVTVTAQQSRGTAGRARTGSIVTTL